MLISKYLIMDGMSRLKNILKSSSMNEQKRNKMFQDILREVLISTEELAAYFNSYHFMQVYDRVNSFRDRYQTLTHEQLVREVDALKEYVDSIIDYNRGDHTDFEYNIRRDNNAEHTLNEEELYHIASRINYPSRDIKILDPLCINSTAVQLGQSIHNKKIYGITQDERHNRAITNYMNSLAIGRGSKAKITNNVFDLMVIKSRVTWTIDTAMMKKVYSLKSEKNNFVSNMKYLREGGVVVMIMPFGKITNDMLDGFCRHLENVQIFRPSNDLYNQNHYAIVMGRKRSLTRKGLDEEQYERLKETYVKYSEVPRINAEATKIYNIPSVGLNVENFRGSIIDESVVQSVLASTKILSQLLHEKLHEDDAISDVRPPLPFNTGQIGLVLTSGCLDGVIEEGDDFYHVIKGRVVKSSTKTQEEVDDNTYDTVETINNKVEISVMLPNGEYRVLA